MRKSLHWWVSFEFGQNWDVCIQVCAMNFSPLLPRECPRTFNLFNHLHAIVLSFRSVRVCTQTASRTFANPSALTLSLVKRWRFGPQRKPPMITLVSTNGLSMLRWVQRVLMGVVVSQCRIAYCLSFRITFKKTDPPYGRNLTRVWRC